MHYYSPIGFHTQYHLIQQLYPPRLEGRWVKYNKWNKESCLLCLPGRCNHALELAYAYHKIGLRSFIIGITPIIRSWYPMPNGVGDQQEAIDGILPAVKVIEEVIKIIETKVGIPRSKIVLAGHSAGAVMAIMVGALSSSPFAGIISHCGAILDPEMLPNCRCSNTPFLLTHSKDDFIFEWHERFMPMFTTLKENKYRVYTVIDKEAGHCITDRQLELSKLFIEEVTK